MLFCYLLFFVELPVNMLLSHSLVTPLSIMLMMGSSSDHSFMYMYMLITVSTVHLTVLLFDYTVVASFTD